MGKNKLNRYFLGLFAAITLCVGTVWADKKLYCEPVPITTDEKFEDAATGEQRQSHEVVAPSYKIHIIAPTNPALNTIITSFDGQVSTYTIGDDGLIDSVEGVNKKGRWSMRRVAQSKDGFEKWNIQGMLKYNRHDYDPRVKKYVTILDYYPVEGAHTCYWKDVVAGNKYKEAFKKKIRDVRGTKPEASQ